MKKYFYTVISVFIVLVLHGCKEETPPQEYTAIITFIEPDEGAVFAGGDELHIELDFENDDVIHNVEVIALNTTNGDTLLYFTSNVNTANLYQFHEHTDLPAVSVMSAGKVTARTWDGDKTDAITKSVNFVINP